MSEPAHRLAMGELRSKMLARLWEHDWTSLKDVRILEVGCGSGFWLREFVQWGAQPGNICGVDLLPERIAEARRSAPANINLQCRNAAQLDTADGAYDLVLQSTVFTSILDPKMKQQIASEMLRVLRPTGIILWYDFFRNNPQNGDVRGVTQKEIAQLFPDCRIQMEKLTLAPPLGRAIAKISTPLYRGLSRIKTLCTHYLGTITKLAGGNGARL